VTSYNRQIVTILVCILLLLNILLKSLNRRVFHLMLMVF